MYLLVGETKGHSYVHVSWRNQPRICAFSHLSQKQCMFSIEENQQGSWTKSKLQWCLLIYVNFYGIFGHCSTGNLEAHLSLLRAVRHLLISARSILVSTSAMWLFLRHLAWIPLQQKQQLQLRRQSAPTLQVIKNPARCLLLHLPIHQSFVPPIHCSILEFVICNITLTFFSKWTQITRPSWSILSFAVSRLIILQVTLSIYSWIPCSNLIPPERQGLKSSNSFFHSVQAGHQFQSY